MGFLIEPFDSVNDYKKKLKRIPKGVGDHRGAQTQMQTVDARSMNADGVLGRLMKHLNTREKMPFKTDLFGFQNKKILEGSASSPYILSKTSSTGIPRFEQLSRYKQEIEHLTSRVPFILCRFHVVFNH